MWFTSIALQSHSFQPNFSSSLMTTLSLGDWRPWTWPPHHSPDINQFSHSVQGEVATCKVDRNNPAK